MNFFDVISYNKGKGTSNGNNYWKKYTVPHYIYIGLMLVLMGIGIGLVSLFVCSFYLGNGDWEMFLSYLHEPLILLLNILPCVLLVAFFYFATGRSWISFLVSALIVFIMSAINYYKIRIRNEAFTASDMVLFSEATGIISRYTLEITGRILLAVFSLIFGTVFAVFFMKGKLRNVWVRVIGSILSLGALVGLVATVYQDDGVYSKAVNNTAEYNVWSDFQIFVSKGFVYPFLHSIQDAIPSPPEGYSESKAAAILSQYSSDTIPDDKKVNIISVMLEAYTDLSEHPEIAVDESVYAPLHALQEESLSGHIISNVFAGGTVNTERNFLTGYTVSEDYRTDTSSYVYYLRSQGYYAEGFHTGDNWFYNRENVEAYLGMENFYFLQDYDTEDRSDKFFFSVLGDLYENRDKSTPYFNFSVTYQNHGAYTTSWTYDESFLDSTGLSTTTYNILNNYLYGIADTTQRIYDFIDSFRDSDEPVVIVFFGDHMPWLGDGNSVYTELGINIDLSTEEGFYNYYSTPYIIWANDAAKSVTGGSFTGDGGDISSCFLMNKIFEECSWGGSAFMKINRELYNTMNVVNTGSYIYSIDGTLTREPTGDALELLNRFKYVEYYMKHNMLYT
jgi:phosphoglycerol transferase MdoB-like AlkP superfamily enzyme